MKTSISVTVLAAAMTTLVIGDPQPPVGTLTAKHNTVISGSLPTLTWSVTHPSRDIDNIVKIESDGDVVTKNKVRVDVYMLGTSVSTDFGQTQHEITTQIDLGSGYQDFFTGEGKDVVPSDVLISGVVPAGTKINFRAYFTEWVDNKSEQVIVLKDDDTPPAQLVKNGAAYQQNYLSGLLRNSKLDMGPFDLIYCVELTHTDKNSSGYDLQDCIVLLRFTEIDY